MDTSIQQSEHLLLSNNIHTTVLARNIHGIHELLLLHLRLPAFLQMLRLLRPRRRERLRAVRAVRADAMTKSAVLAEATAALEEVRADLRAWRRTRRRSRLLTTRSTMAVLEFIRGIPRRSVGIHVQNCKNALSRRKVIFVLTGILSIHEKLSLGMQISPFFVLEFTGRRTFAAKSLARSEQAFRLGRGLGD